MKCLILKIIIFQSSAVEMVFVAARLLLLLILLMRCCCWKIVEVGVVVDLLWCVFVVGEVCVECTDNHFQLQLPGQIRLDQGEGIFLVRLYHDANGGVGKCT